MAERWYGVEAKGSKIVVVGIEYPDTPGTLPKVFYDQTWPVATEPVDRHVKIFDRVMTQIKGNQIDAVAIKGSGALRQNADMDILESAEIRGVVIAAAAKHCQRVYVNPPDVFNKLHEYYNDDSYWESSVENGHIQKNLRKMSRHAAFQVVERRKMVVHD